MARVKKHRRKHYRGGGELQLAAEWLFPGTSMTGPNPTPDSSVNSNDAQFTGDSPFYGDDELSATFQAGSFASSGVTRAKADADPSIADIWAGGGKVTANFFAIGYGGGNAGRIVDNAQLTSGWAIFIRNSSMSVAFLIRFTTGVKVWAMDNPLSLSTWYSVEVQYDSDNVLNVPVIKIGGGAAEDITLVTDTTGGLGIRGDDSANDLYLGNNSGIIRGWNGRLDNIRLHKR